MMKNVNFCDPINFLKGGALLKVWIHEAACAEVTKQFSS